MNNWVAHFRRLAKCKRLALGIAAITAGIVLLVAPAATWAQRIEPLPKELEGIGVTEHLGKQIPLDLEFVTPTASRPRSSSSSTGAGRADVELLQLPDALQPSTQRRVRCDEANAVEHRRPVPNGHRQLRPAGNAGASASLTKQKYLEIYGRAGAADGWHFLTGKEDDIKKLTEAVGFRYKYSESKRQYFHVAVTYILTPDGHLSRYLYGVEYDPQTLRLSLLEAADGKIGSATDQVLLFCFHYDAQSGRYGLAATRLLQAGGGITVVILGVAIWILRRREKAKDQKTKDRG